MSLTDILESPPVALLESLQRYGAGGPLRTSHDDLLASLPFGPNELLLVKAQTGTKRARLLRALQEADVASFASKSAFEVIIGIAGEAGRDLPRQVLGRGVAAVSLHDALAQLIGLPNGWRASQEHFLRRPLEPLRIDGNLRVADLHAVVAAKHTTARPWIRDYLRDWAPPPANVIYIEAEAGKGKSILLAEAVLWQLENATGPLALYVPMRSIQRGAGVSWPDVAACLGLVGPVVDSVANALRSGLISLVLDGLDEIAGRYDPTIVSGVLDEVFGPLRSDRSRLVLSGRKTEASLLGKRTCLRLGLELPATSEPAFTDYARIVTHSVAPSWPSLYPRVPEPPLDVPTLPVAQLSPEQEQRILDWIALVFDDLGKERSLFFVQSLACLARTYQLAGNRPLVIHSRSGSQLARAGLYDVCVLAASLACIREQDKVEDIAKELFTPYGQLDLLTWLALRSAAPESIGAQLPNPNELAKDAFKIDPVNQNEEFTAVVRQTQKHALLFASVDASLRIGDWRPSFLSEWIRDALICRAWRLRDAMAGRVSLETIEHAVARSERAGLAFRYIFPQLADEQEHRADVEALCSVLRASAAAGVPEACAHYWEMRTGLSVDSESLVGPPPSELIPLADLSGLEFEGLDLGAELSGSVVVFVGAQFNNCRLRGVRLEQCDLTNAAFVGCAFEGVEIAFCDGPMVFENCRFENSRLLEFRGRSHPAATFVGCTFCGETRLSQAELVGLEYVAAFRFEGCTSAAECGELLRGDGLGFDVGHVEGLSVVEEREADLPAACLRALLKPFFPTWAGGGGAQRQARAYIRTSAIGRGSLPPGAPSTGVLEEVLRSAGFTSGGRQAHLYAPWASIVAGGADAVALRNEMSVFMTTGARSPRISGMIERIARSM